VRHDHIPSRPHVQGWTAPLRLRHSAYGLTDGAGLVLFRRMWDRFHVGAFLDARAAEVPGRFRSGLMVEVWVALLVYGGAVMDDLRWFGGRGIRRLFGWKGIPDPTTFGRWLRRAGPTLVPVLDELIWHLVRSRWAEVGVPERATLVLDSTVAVRYGAKQAGAEKGYNPKKRGRPSHHPLIATLAETGDLMGVRWRPGSASAAKGATEWLPLLVARLREAGVSDITVRLDKGFFSRAMVECLQDLGVSFLLKVPDHRWVRGALGPMHRSRKSLEITKDPALAIWSASGILYDTRLLSLEWRRTEDRGEELFERTRITQRSHVLTNLPGLRALSAWRAYNDGAVVEQRIARSWPSSGPVAPPWTTWPATPSSGRWPVSPTNSYTKSAPPRSRAPGVPLSPTASGTGSSVCPASSPATPASSTSSSFAASPYACSSSGRSAPSASFGRHPFPSPPPERSRTRIPRVPGMARGSHRSARWPEIRPRKQPATSLRAPLRSPERSSRGLSVPQ